MVSFSPVAWLQLGAGTVEIELEHAPTMVAPSQVWLRAVNHAGLASFEESGSVYDGAHHEYYHEWTINGSPLSDWTKPTNLIAAYNNPNKAFGREVAFLLPTAGTYVIDLVVTDRYGNQAVASTSTLTVVTPESHYAEARRVYVDPDGDFTGVPGGALTATTFDSLMTAIDPFTWNVNPPWVLFRGGKTHDLGTSNPGVAGSDGHIRISDTKPAQRFSSFGTGQAKLVPSTNANRAPTFAMIEIWDRPVTDFLCFTGIDFEGYYDAATERGGRTANGAIGLAANSYLTDTFVMVHDCTFTGLDKCLNLGAPNALNSNNRMMIADCAMTNWRDYGSFGGAASYRYAFLGNRIAQNVNALHGGGRTDELTGTHNPVRIPEAAYVHFEGNDLFSRTGWSAGGGGNRADQPCLRLLVSPRTGQSAHVSRNVMEGGYEVINLEDANQVVGFPAVPFNVVVENNLLVATAKNMGMAMGVWRSGLTARNNVFVFPDVPQPPGYVNSTAAFRLEEGAGFQTTANESNPIVIHGNTYLNLMSEPNAGGDAWPFLLNDAGFFTNVTEENNVTHRPNMTQTAIASAPIDLATAVSGFTPRFVGTRYGYPVASVTLPGNVANGGTFTVPYASLLKVLNDGTAVSGGGATNQAYWTAIEATDTKHVIWLDTQTRSLSAEHSQISVTFGVSEVTITNNSGYTWTGGQLVIVHLDRTSLIPAMDTAYASPATIPLPRPTTGSAAIDAATTGRVQPVDALLTSRGATPSQGALEPV